MTHCEANDLDHLVLFLDFKKAFDSVSHRFLFALLHHISLPDGCIQWIHIIYSSALSVVQHKNWLTVQFPLE